MNHKNARLAKMWTAGERDLGRLGRKLGLTGLTRVVEGLRTLAAAGAITGFPPIPSLEPHCGSWIVVRRATGEVVGEFFERASVERFDPAVCEVRTAQQHLAAVNRALQTQK